MLAGIEPDLEFALADVEAVDLLPVERLAERFVGDAGHARDRRDQIMVPLHRIRREIGEPEIVALSLMADRQDLAVIAGLGQPPVLAILGPARRIARPALRVSRTAGIEDTELNHAPLRAEQAEVEPLVEIGLVILDDLQIERVAVLFDDTDIAAVEGGRNVGCHFTVIVRPETPGKPWKTAEASRRTAASG